MINRNRLLCFVVRFSCLTLILTKTSPPPPILTSHLNSTAPSSRTKNSFNNTTNTTKFHKKTVNISSTNTANQTILPLKHGAKVDNGNVTKNVTSNSTNLEHHRNGTTISKNHAFVCKERRTFLQLQSNNSCYLPDAALRCFHDPIFCKKYFTSGKRNLQKERPAYGEYSMLKHEHWFHVIQHGGIAFLFHPCTEKKEIENLRQVASSCLHRYVLAPYKKLSEKMPLALVSWGCFYMSTKVDELQMMNWIRKNAYSGPASHVHTNGKFKKNLVKHSKVLTDVKDVILCPNEEQLNSFMPTKKPVTNVDPESIIHKRVIKLSKIKPAINISANISVTKVQTGSAVWAAASLVFLCGILVGWLLYTKVWTNPSNSQNDYRYAPLGNENESRSFECEPGESQFNLLKSSQQFMSAFRWKGKQKSNKKDEMRMNLMVPINEGDEDDDDDDVLFER